MTLMSGEERTMMSRALAIMVALVLITAIVGPAFVASAGVGGRDGVGVQARAGKQERGATEVRAKAIAGEGEQEVTAEARTPAGKSVRKNAGKPAAAASAEADPVTVEPPKEPRRAAIVPAAGSSVAKPADNGEAPLPGYFRIDPVPSGTSHYVWGSYEVTITVYQVSDVGWLFDFESNTPVVSVKAKGGPDPNWYTYDPPVYSATGLHAPANPSGTFPALSHIDFKFGLIPEPELGSITVVKFHDLDADGYFDSAEEEPLDGWTFTLTGPGGTRTGASGRDGAGTIVFAGLPAGTYTLDEAVWSGWHATRALPISITLTSVTSAAVPYVTSETVVVGNVENSPVMHLKTFDLTWDEAPQGASVWVSFTVDGGPAQTLALAWEVTRGVFTGSVSLPHGSVIGDVEWWANVGGEDHLLGTSGGEVLEGDVTNAFDYDPTVGGYKFNDLDGDGTWDEGEPPLEGWRINLYRLEMVTDLAHRVTPADVSATLIATTLTGPDGSYSFDGMLPGTYYVTEKLQYGWTQTVGPDFTFVVSDGVERMDLVFGNHENPPQDVTKTFELTFVGEAPEGTSFWVHYMLDGMVDALGPVSDGAWLELTGEGPYTASIDLPAGTTILSVHWYAFYGLEQILLGTTGPETITEDTLNAFSYDGSVSGYKFNDLDADGVWDEDEPGLPGWTINLYRVPQSIVPSVIPPVLYASKVTGADGSYSFTGVLPGTYFVTEEMQDGWTQTVAPEGTFEVVDDQPITGLIFGNTEEFAPFTEIDLAITKTADPSVVATGDVITYTLTYWNAGETTATDFTITDDFDERYVTVTDAAGGTVVDGTIVWTLPGPLAPADGPQTIVYTVKVDDDVPDTVTSIDNVVVIEHPEDSDPSNNRDEASVEVEPYLPYTPPSEEEPFLPFTGAEAVLLVAIAGVSLAIGALLRRRLS